MGLGHTISLLVVGTRLLLTGTMLLRAWRLRCELFVAVMHVALGVRSLVTAIHQHQGTRTFVLFGVVSVVGLASGTALASVQRLATTPSRRRWLLVTSGVTSGVLSISLGVMVPMLGSYGRAIGMCPESFREAIRAWCVTARSRPRIGPSCRLSKTIQRWPQSLRTRVAQWVAAPPRDATTYTARQ